ncbi:MAG TPA: IclR family transcriptional regulator C-terminal domain-containing protein [Burkholderiaceae bacterium]|nr:IclR family transcriptional regulator C-terminal domain-containing protein [Burkholderiaceae bacterium]
MDLDERPSVLPGPTSTPPAAGASATPGDADTEGGWSRRDLVGGLEKGLLVIEAFDQERARLSISEVAQRAGLSRAAARRYLLTLAHLGYVDHDGKGFALSPRVLRLGQSYMHSARLPRVLQPELQRLAAAMQEATSAGVLDDDEVVSLAAATGGRVVSTTLQPGARVPAYCTANGRVLLAALGPAELDAWLARQTLAPRTPHTLTDVERLRAEIGRVRAQGYALVDQELEPGLRTLSVPVVSADGQVLAALNVSAHAARHSTDQLIDHCLPALRQTQAALRRQL